MKTFLFALLVAGSVVFGFNSVNASELPVNTVETESTNSSRTVRVYEDGAIWVYVYSEDGAFITKYMEQN